MSIKFFLYTQFLRTTGMQGHTQRIAHWIIRGKNWCLTSISAIILPVPPCNWLGLRSFAHKAHYHNRVLNQIDINSTFGNPTYSPASFSKDQILRNYVLVSVPVNGTND